MVGILALVVWKGKREVLVWIWNAKINFVCYGHRDTTFHVIVPNFGGQATRHKGVQGKPRLVGPVPPAPPALPSLSAPRSSSGRGAQFQRT